MRRIILEILVIAAIIGGAVYLAVDYYQPPAETNYRIYLYASDGHVIQTLDGKFRLKMKNGSLVVYDGNHQHLLTGTTVVDTY